MRLLNSKVATREEEEYKGIDSVNIIYITIGFLIYKFCLLSMLNI